MDSELTVNSAMSLSQLDQQSVQEKEISTPDEKAESSLMVSELVSSAVAANNTLPDSLLHPKQSRGCQRQVTPH